MRAMAAGGRWWSAFLFFLLLNLGGFFERRLECQAAATNRPLNRNATGPAAGTTTLLDWPTGKVKGRQLQLEAAGEAPARALQTVTISDWPVNRGDQQGAGRGSSSPPGIWIRSQIRWTYNGLESSSGGSNMYVFLTSTVIGSDQTVYVGACLASSSSTSACDASQTNYLLAFVGATGALKWELTDPSLSAGGGSIIDPVIYADGTIYTASGNTLIAISDLGTSGSVRWTYNKFLTVGPLMDFVAQAATLYYPYSNYVVYRVSYGGTSGTNYLLFMTTDGLLGFQSPAFGSTSATTDSLVMDSTASAVYTVGNDGFISAFYMSSGSQKWSVKPLAMVGTVAPGLAYSSSLSYIYFAHPAGKLLALSAASGGTAWTYQSAASSGSTSVYWSSVPGLGSDGTIFIGSSSGDGAFYAVTSAGALKWKKTYTVSSSAALVPLFTSSPAVSSDNVVYSYATTASYVSSLMAISGSSGALLWTWNSDTDGGTDQRYNSHAIGPSMFADGSVLLSAYRVVLKFTLDTNPSGQPTGQPSRRPTRQPTRQPTGQPSRQPTRQPTKQPSVQPTRQPTGQPSMQPSGHPTGQPSRQPTGQPTGHPSQQPSGRPSRQPSGQPTGRPTAQPFQNPSSQPSVQPSACPSQQPASRPSGVPTQQPVGQPTCQPSGQPTARPSQQPASRPSGEPTAQPSAHPSGQPAAHPTGQPSRQPTSLPTTQPTTFVLRSFTEDLSETAQEHLVLILSTYWTRQAYEGPILRLRRSSDDAEMDFYTDRIGNWGTALGGGGMSVHDWRGRDTVYCRTWYDQSANRNDATQTDTTRQPTINFASGLLSFVGDRFMVLPYAALDVGLDKPYTLSFQHGNIKSTNGGIISRVNTMPGASAADVSYDRNGSHYTSLVFNQTKNFGNYAPSVPVIEVYDATTDSRCIVSGGETTCFTIDNAAIFGSNSSAVAQSQQLQKVANASAARAFLRTARLSRDQQRRGLSGVSQTYLGKSSSGLYLNGEMITINAFSATLPKSDLDMLSTKPTLPPSEQPTNAPQEAATPILTFIKDNKGLLIGAVLGSLACLCCVCASFHLHAYRKKRKAGQNDPPEGEDEEAPEPDPDAAEHLALGAAPPLEPDPVDPEHIDVWAEVPEADPDPDPDPEPEPEPAPSWPSMAWSMQSLPPEPEAGVSADLDGDEFSVSADFAVSTDFAVGGARLVQSDATNVAPFTLRPPPPLSLSSLSSPLGAPGPRRLPSTDADPDAGQFDVAAEFGVAVEFTVSGARAVQAADHDARASAAFRAPPRLSWQSASAAGGGSAGPSTHIANPADISHAVIPVAIPEPSVPDHQASAHAAPSARVAAIRAELAELFRKYSPARLPGLDALLQANAGKEEQLLSSVRETYSHNADVRAELVRIYSHVNPAKLEGLDSLLESRRGSELQLLREVRRKYDKQMGLLSTQLDVLSMVQEFGGGSPARPLGTGPPAVHAPRTPGPSPSRLRPGPASPLASTLKPLTLASPTRGPASRSPPTGPKASIWAFPDPSASVSRLSLAPAPASASTSETPVQADAPADVHGHDHGRADDFIILRGHLSALLSQVKPARGDTVDALLADYAGREETLLPDMHRKYAHQLEVLSMLSMLDEGDEGGGQGDQGDQSGSEGPAEGGDADKGGGECELS